MALHPTGNDILLLTVRQTCCLYPSYTPACKPLSRHLGGNYRRRPALSDKGSARDKDSARGNDATLSRGSYSSSVLSRGSQSGRFDSCLRSAHPLERPGHPWGVVVDPDPADRIEHDHAAVTVQGGPLLGDESGARS